MAPEAIKNSIHIISDNSKIKYDIGLMPSLQKIILESESNIILLACKQ